MERIITLNNLSDKDCTRLCELCKGHGITVSYLLESFIGDLINGSTTNGSDERMCANTYFSRCLFGMFPERTLLNWLSENCYDIYDDFVWTLDEIEWQREKLNQILDETDTDIIRKAECAFLTNHIADNEAEINEIKSSFLRDNPDANWNSETEYVKKWWSERECLLNHAITHKSAAKDFMNHIPKWVEEQLQKEDKSELERFLVYGE